MKKKVLKKSRTSYFLLIVAIVLFTVFIIVPTIFSLFNGSKLGNTALIPVSGVITGSGGKVLGASTISSQSIVDFIEKADENPAIKVIVLEINSPGGSAVASDEIGQAVKNAEKPVLSYIREVGASGGYWVASATDQIFANRMTITGSIGVISSYLEFSGLMEEYGVGYERLVSGKNKDMGTPFKKLTPEEREVMQKKIDLIHDFFIEEVANNRGLSIEKVRDLATGEIFLGVEAKQLGLVDQLGDMDTVSEYIKKQYHLEEVVYSRYESKPGLFDLLTGVLTDLSFNFGQGIGSLFVEGGNKVMLI